MRYGLSALLAVALFAPTSFAALSSNIVGGGDFEDFGTTVYTADSGQQVTDYTYFKHEHSPKTQAEINAGTNPVRAWQFHPEFDFGRWIPVYGAGGAFPGDYDGQTGVSVFEDPRSYWNDDPDYEWTQAVSTINISEDPLNPGNHVMEGVRFRTWLGQIVRAPENHVPGTATIDFDYYFNNWTGLPPGSPGTDAASIFHVWIWGVPDSDMPTWSDRFGMPGGHEVYPYGTVFPNSELVFCSPNWSEWGWTAPGSDKPQILSLGDQWNDFSVDHPDLTDVQVPTVYSNYYIAVWECVYSEPHAYQWFYGGKPADSFAVGIDNIELKLQVSVPGDFNNDGICSLLDINDFVTAIVDFPAYMTTYPYAHIPTIDPSQMGASGDPIINLLDIPYFVSIVTGSGIPTELPEPATVGLIGFGALALLRRRTA